MFPHPETVCTIKEMDRKALLAEAELARLAKEATHVPRPARKATLRTVIGGGLIRIGLALQGAPTPVVPTAPAAD